ncbi:YfcL family protein [Vibrio sp.]|uniref:YfcL family protein n=1 Tax=Vibrio sp. TaxID=678 RepID=UPI003D111283
MITEYEEQLLELIDARIHAASDDELFAGGYLRGHISLSAAECEEQGINDVAQLKQLVNASLEKARSELTPADRTIVQDLWLELQNQL